MNIEVASHLKEQRQAFKDSFPVLQAIVIARLQVLKLNYQNFRPI
jgi:hypothetical protein